MTTTWTKLLPGLAALLFCTASADAPDYGKKQLQAFIGSDVHKGLLDRALLQVSPAVFQRCNNLVSAGSSVTIIEPINFDANNIPVSGVWRESFPVKGCGNDTTLKFYFGGTTAAKINTVIGMPGATKADPTLQHDAFRYTSMAAAVAAPPCTDFVVENTAFGGTQSGQAAVAHPPWHETWTLLGCGRTLDIPVDFTPDANGTQITAGKPTPH